MKDLTKSVFTCNSDEILYQNEKNYVYMLTHPRIKSSLNGKL